MSADLRRLRAKFRARHMELLDVLGQTCNIHQAAPRLHLSQPAVSKLLHEVEAMYGVALFERLPRGLRPTPAGEVAIRWARLALKGLEDALTETEMVAHGAVGRVRIGILAVAIPKLLSEVLKVIKKDYPGLVVTVTEGGNDALLPSLARNELDLVLGRLNADTEPSALITEKLYEESVSLVTRKGHPLSRKRKVLPTDLSGVEWILQPEMQPMRKQLETMLFAHGIAKPRPNLETGSILLMTLALADSDMVAVMPQSVAEFYAKKDQLAILKMALSFELPPIGVVYPENAQRAAHVETFLEIVRSVAKRLRTH